jgi:poly(A) polymerase
MLEDGVLAHWAPEAQRPDRLERLVVAERRAAAPDPLRRLAALCVLDRARAEALTQRLRFSNAQSERLVEMADPPDRPQPGWDRRAVRRALYRWGAAAWRDAVLLAWADDPDAARDAGYEALLGMADGWTPPRFPLRGRDATALGVAPGPDVGRLLGAVEAWWEEGDYTADRAACLARLKALAGRD